MSAAPLWRDARDAMRLDALRRTLVRRHEWATLPLHSFALRRLSQCAPWAVMWALPAVFALWPPDRAMRVLLFVWSIAFWVLVLRKWARRGDGASGSSGIGAFALLHAPSRSGLLAARWLRALPWLLWVGGCAVVAVARWNDTAARAPIAVASVGLAPLLLFAFRTWTQLANDQGDRTLRVLGGIALLSLGMLTGVGAIAGAIGAVGGHSSGWWVVFVLVAVTGCVAYLAPRVFGDGRRSRPTPDAVVRVTLRYAAVLVAAAWAVTVLLALDSKHRQDLAASLDALGPWAGPATLAPMLLAGCVFVVDQFEWIETAEGGVFARKRPSSSWRPSVGRSRDVATASGRVMAGRGLWRAHWRRFREEKLSALDSIVFVVISLRGPVFAACALASTEPVVMLGCAMAALTAPRLVGIEIKEIDRLRLFGVSLRAIARHNMVALFVAAAVPTLGVAVIAGSVAGWTDGRFATFELIAAGFVLRAGFAGLARVARWIGALQLAALAIGWWIAAPAAVAYFLPVPDIDVGPAWAMVLPVLFPGLIGIAFGPLFLSEATLRDERSRLAEGPTRRARAE